MQRLSSSRSSPKSCLCQREEAELDGRTDQWRSVSSVGTNRSRHRGFDVLTSAGLTADNAEYIARDAANIQFLRESFDLARARDARGLVVVIQADPSFDLPETESDNERTCVRAGQAECVDAPNATNPFLANYDGYTNFLGALKENTASFAGQVVLVHGDTHFFKIDKPGFVDALSQLPNFTRVCTFGSPNVHWVQVTVDSKSRNVFTFEPMIVQP
jgi:hypothetical protein